MRCQLAFQMLVITELVSNIFRQNRVRVRRRFFSFAKWSEAHRSWEECYVQGCAERTPISIGLFFSFSHPLADDRQRNGTLPQVTSNWNSTFKFQIRKLNCASYILCFISIFAEKRKKYSRFAETRRKSLRILGERKTASNYSSRNS